MPQNPSEILTDHLREVSESNNSKCVLLQPIVVHFEFVADHVDEQSYWVTSAEAVDDCYGTGYTEDEALADLLEAYAENIEWYETEATERNEMLDDSYHRLCEYVRLTTKRRR